MCEVENLVEAGKMPAHGAGKDDFSLFSTLLSPF